MEIFFNGAYGTICDEGFGYYDAQVVCRQLGFKSAVRAFPGVSCGRKGEGWEGRRVKGIRREREGRRMKPRRNYCSGQEVRDSMPD